MDRSWIRTSKPGDPEYEAGVIQFINFAIKNGENREKLPCPCYKCHNLMHKRIDEILNHLSKWSFDKTYTCWIWHGEKRVVTQSASNENSVCDDHDVLDEGETLEDMLHAVQDKFNDNPTKFESLLSDSEKPLYPGCESSKLSAILKLYNLKAAHGLSDVGFTDFLETIKGLLPKENVLPRRTYEAKKTLSTMGLRYEKIHACPNNCILYRNEHELLKNCPVCNSSRYKKKEGVPAKVLWYFPIIPRFKRLFSISGDAEQLTWHEDGRKKDGKLRHPADSEQWRFIDSEFSDFGKEKRNLRLALSTDGMNPYGSLSSIHSTWPVILVTYNLPPSLCMKRRYMMLSLLISGPKQPGNDIDVYLAPLIEDLKILWEQGVEVFDAHRNEMFTLRAMLFCTISDFPAYGNLSGYTVYGKSPCPVCEDELEGDWLTASNKNVFMVNRRFLPLDHPYRKQKKAFNGEQEFKSCPKVLTGVQMFEKVKDIDITFGKKYKKNLPKQGYKKCSIFWSLPYWKHLFVRHCLDVMHIEKNVCDSLVGTLLNINGKTKDGKSAREDLKEMGIRKELHPVENNNRTYLPPAAYTLSRSEKKELCESLARVKVPQGFSSNFSKLVNMETLNLVGLKSHDCHVLMQHLLPVAIRSILPRHVRYAIFRLCSFFRFIYSKVIDLKDLKFWEDEIVVILCQLEMYFPPSFFDVMVHLNIHLAREVRYCGPVSLRNEYPFERQMKTYKGYVKNPFRPEACIAERLFYEGVLEFTSQYLGNAPIVGLPLSRHSGRMEGDGTIGHRKRDLTYEEWHMAHTYILLNEDEVAPYADQHIAFLKDNNRRWTQKAILDEHSKSFSTWFNSQILGQSTNPSVRASNRLKHLAFGPQFNASFYSGFVINGCTFYTKCQDEVSTMQNSGIMVEAEAMHFSSAKDKRPVYGKMRYYGVIEEIFELVYSSFTIPVFKCKWVDNNNGVEHDASSGFTIVNFDKPGHKEDPYILASQAKQVFYMTDPADKKKSVVICPQSRLLTDEYDDDTESDEEEDRANDLVPKNQVVDDCFDDHSTYVRDDHEEGMWIESSNKESRSRKRSRNSR